jgi:Fe-S-cluster containining protein
MLKREKELSSEINIEQPMELVPAFSRIAGAKSVTANDLCLLNVCTDCHGRCCVGRTLAVESERERIIAYSGQDHFVHWADDIYYLDRGTCPYLKANRCSVQDVKPFVCQIYPFVPRVVDGQFWLFCVWECDAGKKLTSDFVENARTLARQFFSSRRPEVYVEYWAQNKIGDFDDDRVLFKVKVFDDIEGDDEKL